MDATAVCERVWRIADARGDMAVGLATLEGGLQAVREVRAWLDAAEADLARRLSDHVSFPEKSIADAARTTVTQGGNVLERAATLAAAPTLAIALDNGRATAGHVDAVTRVAKSLPAARRTRLLAAADALAPHAATESVAEFRARLAREAARIHADDSMARLERQRRAARLRSWTDSEGMWCLAGRFDPLTGAVLHRRIHEAVEALFRDATPDSCPDDPLERYQHLQALALAHLLRRGDARSADASPPGAARDPRLPSAEIVVVVDTRPSAAGGGPIVDWGIPVEIPLRVLADLAHTADVHTVVVRNGVVLHAPGRLNLGRTTRLANRAQRRALRALYGTCGIPGCGVRFDHCDIHHVTWWERLGRTDLDNLLPVCAHHHAQIHRDGWILHLAPDRTLTLTLPDGTIHITGPPQRTAA